MKYFFMGIPVIVLVWAGTFALMIEVKQMNS
ncbi:membrane protein YpdK [Shigella flexneri]